MPDRTIRRLGPSDCLASVRVRGTPWRRASQSTSRADTRRRTGYRTRMPPIYELNTEAAKQVVATRDHATRVRVGVRSPRPARVTAQVQLIPDASPTASPTDPHNTLRVLRFATRSIPSCEVRGHGVTVSCKVQHGFSRAHSIPYRRHVMQR